mmetsp:Transcript_41936/g.82009  ORF Transcript_41936/g.82009 Transcript_41936/m.82009 type:complete len:438 (-) Transcript_41936:58-1371(-)
MVLLSQSRRPREARWVWAVASASLLVAAVIVVSHRSPTLLLQGDRVAGGHADLSSGLSNAGAAFDAHAAWLERSAAQSLRQAKEERAVMADLKASQSELNAYAVNLEGMMEAGGDASMRGKLAQFPKEAANLHALLDETLGKADAVAVQMSEGNDALPVASSRPLQHAFPPKGWTPESDPAAMKDIEQTMQKLRRVKSFGHSRAAAREGGAAVAGKASAKKGTTQMLVQPSPLLGSLPVRHGELYRDGVKWQSTEVVPEESENDRELDLVLQQDFNATNEGEIPEGMNATMAAMEHELTPQELIRACNSTCQHLILHSTIGLAFKVAAKCVPECATSKFILDKKGAALPAWETVEQLKEQDHECSESHVYLTCKQEAIEPACDKIATVMPSYCPSHPKESICVECAQIEAFEEEQRHAVNVKEGHADSGCLFGLFGC